MKHPKKILIKHTKKYYNDIFIKIKRFKKKKILVEVFKKKKNTHTILEAIDA